jgi:hypothetical protein
MGRRLTDTPTSTPVGRRSVPSRGVVLGRFLKGLAAAGVVLTVLSGGECRAQMSPIDTGKFYTGKLVQGTDPYSGLGILGKDGEWEMYSTSTNGFGFYLEMWVYNYPGVFIGEPVGFTSDYKYIIVSVDGWIYDYGQPTDTSRWVYREHGYVLLDPATWTGFWAVYYYYFWPSQIYYVQDPAWWQISFTFDPPSR